MDATDNKLNLFVLGSAGTVKHANRNVAFMTVVVNSEEELRKAINSQFHFTLANHLQTFTLRTSLGTDHKHLRQI